MLTDAQGAKTFLQEVPIIKKVFKGDSTLLVKSKGEIFSFKQNEGFLFAQLGPLDVLDREYRPLFIGFSIHEPDHGWDDLKGLELKGRSVIIIAGAPIRDGQPVLPEDIHKQYSTLQGLQKKIIPLFRAKSGLCILIADQQILALWGQGRVPPSEQTQWTHAGGEPEYGIITSFPGIMVLKPEIAEIIFKDQVFNPLTVPDENNVDGYTTFPVKEVTFSFDYDIEKTEYESWNVVGVVPGTDPEVNDEYILVSAHLDHMGFEGDQVMNGADDNASGCVSILEVAEAVAMAPPRRSVIFALYAAEEVGLIGSQHFAQECPVPVENILVNINLDMVGRVDPETEEANRLFTIGSAKICLELKDIIVGINESSFDLPLDFGLDENDPQMWFDRSDHVHFHQRGIPCVFLTNTEHSDYHRPTDDAEKIEYESLQRISQFIYSLVMEIGDGEKSLCASGSARH